MKKLIKIFSMFLICSSLSSCAINIPSSTEKGLPAEIYSSFLVCFIGIVFFFIVWLKARKVDPLKKPKGIIALMEIAVTKIDSLVYDNMGKRFEKFSAYLFVVFYYIFGCFFIGITGLANPMQYLMVPVSVSLVTFILIHATAVKYQKWAYFKRYTSPFAIFLPINLISMWAPLISMSCRLFGNALGGYVLMTLLYSAIEGISNMIFGSILVLPPLITPIFHAYFDLFSGAIQTLVFAMLTMLLIAQEGPEEDEAELKAAPINK